ncbi:MAG: hypothetical protein HN742_26915 [Lentisphaerae bacterium]|jgi:hypothetical protein|nr:hypothetical protein [Lentisphaerota bacterium]MBT4820377.1 hypothetical protein [Lentisphaerota bacterium]MBT5606081.1 hypothetical protein [Lentisphaerota bacterium]MBT7057062.1 hypothetical protein [Lentisphaerota bacterium]MBT7845534.1 hypothetical protein [Lentisphaerota bacterium]
MEPDSRRTDKADGGIDWGELVTHIQDRLFMSQLGIAERCGVARQSVSAWVHHRRQPGLYAKRELVVLAAEAGVLDEVAPRDGTEKPQGNARQGVLGGNEQTGGRPGEIPDARQLALLLEQLSPDAREEVLEFTRFKISRERG